MEHLSVDQNTVKKNTGMESATVVQTARTELSTRVSAKKQEQELGITSKRDHSSSTAFYSIRTKTNKQTKQVQSYLQTQQMYSTFEICNLGFRFSMKINCLNFSKLYVSKLMQRVYHQEMNSAPPNDWCQENKNLSIGSHCNCLFAWVGYFLVSFCPGSQA